MAVVLTVLLVVVFVLLFVFFFLRRKKNEKTKDVELELEKKQKKESEGEKTQYETVASIESEKSLGQKPKRAPSTNLVLTINTIPEEDLKIGKQLGKGHFGAVYLADWCGTPVAVKSIHQQGENVRQEYLAEVESMAYDTKYWN